MNREKAREALGPMFVAFRPTNASKANYAATAERKAESLLRDLDADPAARAALLAWLLPVERLAAAIDAAWRRPGSDHSLFGPGLADEGRKLAALILAALTETTGETR